MEYQKRVVTFDVVHGGETTTVQQQPYDDGIKTADIRIPFHAIDRINVKSELQTVTRPDPYGCKDDNDPSAIFWSGSLPPQPAYGRSAYTTQYDFSLPELKVGDRFTAKFSDGYEWSEEITDISQYGYNVQIMTQDAGVNVTIKPSNWMEDGKNGSITLLFSQGALPNPSLLVELSYTKS